MIFISKIHIPHTTHTSGSLLYILNCIHQYRLEAVQVVPSSLQNIENNCLIRGQLSTFRRRISFECVCVLSWLEIAIDFKLKQLLRFLLQPCQLIKNTSAWRKNTGKMHSFYMGWPWFIIITTHFVGKLDVHLLH